MFKNSKKMSTAFAWLYSASIGCDAVIFRCLFEEYSVRVDVRLSQTGENVGGSPVNRVSYDLHGLRRYGNFSRCDLSVKNIISYNGIRCDFVRRDGALRQLIPVNAVEDL